MFNKLTLRDKIFFFALAFAIGYIIIDSIRDNYKENKEADTKIEQAETNIDDSKERVKDKEKAIDTIDLSLEQSKEIKDKAIQDGKKRKEVIDRINNLDSLYNEVARHYR